MHEDLSQKINKLDGIISCKITGDHDIDEVHIIADKRRNPKKIVRDVETIILVNQNKDIDQKKISIAQYKYNDQKHDISRLEIVSIFKENNKPICHYRLKINDQIIKGESNDSSDEPIIYKEYGMKDQLLGATFINQDLPLAVGKACLKALNRKIKGCY